MIGSTALAPPRVPEPEGAKIDRLGKVLVVVYLLEVGLVLIVMPWTQFWDRNYFVESLPALEPTLRSPAIRGGVSGFGIVSIWVALSDVMRSIRMRWS